MFINDFFDVNEGWFDRFKKPPTPERVPLSKEDMALIKSVTGSIYTDGGDVLRKPIWNVYFNNKRNSEIGQMSFGKYNDGKCFVNIPYYRYGVNPYDRSTSPLINDTVPFTTAAELAAILKKARTIDESIKLGDEAAQVTNKHKVMVTVSDPNDPAVTKRNEKTFKTVKVTATSPDEAKAKAEAFYKKKGYRVHDSEYHSQVTEDTISEGVRLQFENRDITSPYELNQYVKEKAKALFDAKVISEDSYRGSAREDGSWRSGFATRLHPGLRRLTNETVSHHSIKPFIDKIKQFDLSPNSKIAVGQSLAVLQFEIIFAYEEIELYGFVSPKKITKIDLSSDKSIKLITFEDGDTYPRTSPVTYHGSPTSYSAFFRDQASAESALTLLTLSLPKDWEIIQHKISENAVDNPMDTIKVNVPLFIRLLEYAREEAKTDMDLHELTEKLIELSSTGNTVTMDQYDQLIDPQGY